MQILEFLLPIVRGFQVRIFELGGDYSNGGQHGCENTHIYRNRFELSGDDENSDQYGM